MARFGGIYRGVVVDNTDPARKLRLKVRVPEVLGTADPWAVPCTPGGSTALPSVGDIVWVMFEKGDPDYPVWLGVLPPVAR